MTSASVTSMRRTCRRPSSSGRKATSSAALRTVTMSDRVPHAALPSATWSPRGLSRGPSGSRACRRCGNRVRSQRVSRRRPSPKAAQGESARTSTRTRRRQATARTPSEMPAIHHQRRASARVAIASLELPLPTPMRIVPARQAAPGNEPGHAGALARRGGFIAVVMVRRRRSAGCEPVIPANRLVPARVRALLDALGELPVTKPPALAPGGRRAAAR